MWRGWRGWRLQSFNWRRSSTRPSARVCGTTSSGATPSTGGVPADGTRPPLDVYQRLVNANFNLNVHRTALLSDFSDLALDLGGAEAFQTFRADLLGLQSGSTDPGERWRMEPKRLKANINA